MKVRIKQLLLLALLACGTQAQAGRITGTVLDTEGQPVVGASVVVKGTGIGVVTGADGAYSISVPDEATTLSVSSIGYGDAELPITGDKMDVKLGASAQAIDDVIVIAYGTTKKSSFTGSASAVKAANLEKRQVSDATKALQGASSGVQVVSLSGQPGTAATVRIRGVGSISASSNPLYVVDGVPYEGSLNTINSSDIESMTVLKDAAANSLYGARGANGVILVTTKKGKTGAPRVTVETRFGYNELGIPTYDVVNSPQQFLELTWEALRNQAITNKRDDPAAWASTQLPSVTRGNGPYYGVPGDELVVDGKLNPNAKRMWTDNWLEDPFSRGFRNEEIVTVSGGTDKTSYYVSGSYLTEDSYIPGSNFERYTARAKVEQEVNSWFRAGANVAYAKMYMNNPWASNTATAYSNLFGFAQHIAPIFPIYSYDENGNPVYDANGNKAYDFNAMQGNVNPISALKNDNRFSDYDHSSTMGFAEVSFLKDFKLRVNITAESYNGFSNRYQTPVGGDALNINGRNTRSADKTFALTAQQLLTYNKTFNDVHHVDVLVGHESTGYRFNQLWAQKENFLVPSNPELSNAARLKDASSVQQNYAIESLLSRVQYDYDERYFLSASFRRDGSSRFHPDVRWGSFWSVGGAWIANKESFMSDFSSWLDELKLKASYGTQGNDNILDSDGYSLYNAYQDQYAVSSLASEYLVATYAMRGNPKLTWEKSQNLNLGVEFGFLGVVFGGFEYYQKKTTDLLYQKPMPTSSGLPNWIYDNAISMKNSGIEIELGVNIFKTSDLTWQIKGNLTTQANEILTLPADKDPEGKGYVSGSYWYKKGNSIYDFYTYKSAGVDPATGKALWWKEVKDAEGNTTNTITDLYSDASRYQLDKSALPKVYGGLETNFSYMGIDFSMQAAYQIGGYGWDEHYRVLMGNFEDVTSTVHMDVVNRRWTTPGQVTDVPRIEYGMSNQTTMATSDRFLVSKSYFSLNNITLGYTLPKKITDRVKIEKVRMYLTGDNLALFSARKGYDPRLSIGGAGTYAYSAMRTISLGLNVNF